MNVLLINHYAGSPRLGMEYRPFYLAREWVRAGHRVQIVAASFSHVRSRQPGVDTAAVDDVIDTSPIAGCARLPTPATAPVARSTSGLSFGGCGPRLGTSPMTFIPMS